MLTWDSVETLQIKKGYIYDKSSGKSRMYKRGRTQEVLKKLRE
jgi:hypothetical protein